MFDEVSVLAWYLWFEVIWILNSTKKYKLAWNERDAVLSVNYFDGEINRAGSFPAYDLSYAGSIRYPDWEKGNIVTGTPADYARDKIGVRNQIFEAVLINHAPIQPGYEGPWMADWTFWKIFGSLLWNWVEGEWIEAVTSCRIINWLMAGCIRGERLF